MRYDGYLWTKASLDRNALSQRYEPIQPIFLMTMASRVQNAVFMDIGANIGAYSVVLGNHENIRKILAFEPNPHCFRELLRNISLNRLDDRATCFDIAVSDRAGEAEFGLTSDLGGDGGLIESHQFLKFIKDMRIVRTRPLDEIFDGANQSMVMKIDVEGHEKSVINGALRVLSENTGFIQIEILDASSNKDEVLDQLKQLGWAPIVKIGNDHYFTNLPSMRSEQDRIDLVEEALGRIVHESLNAPSAARRKILPGIVLELSYRNAQRLKKVLKTLRLRE